MSNNSVIEHRANYYYIMMQEDYLAICSSGKGSPHCKAMILSVLEHWTNTKRDKCEGEYVYLTMPQWIKYTYMLYERNIITDCIKELLEEGKIERRSIIMFSQKTFDYKLCTEKIQECIRALPTKGKDEVTPNLQAYLAFKERGKAERAEKKEKEGVREKSPTSKRGKRESKEVREKSPTVREKSPKVGDNSHRVREKSPQLILSNIPLPSTHIQSDDVANANRHDALSFPSLPDEPSFPAPSEDNSSGEQSTDETPVLHPSQETRTEATTRTGKVSSAILPDASKSAHRETTEPSSKNKQPPIVKETTGEPTMQERIVLVFQSFNEFASEALGQPFEYEQSAKNFGIIGKWLKAKATNPPTKEILHDVFFDMLAEAEGDRSNGSFSWVKNMDIPVVIKQYDRRSLGIMFKRKRHATPKEVKSTAEIAETIGYKIVEADEELAYVPPKRKKA